VNLASIAFVDLKVRGSDEMLERIGQLRGLEHLGLAHSPVTDPGLAHLEGLRSLRWLSLEDSRITDAGLEHFEQPHQDSDAVFGPDWYQRRLAST
jgi:hypothetical protein